MAYFYFNLNEMFQRGRPPIKLNAFYCIVICCVALY